MPETRTISARIELEDGALRRRLQSASSAGRNFGRTMEGVGNRIKRAWRDLGFGRVTSRIRGLASGLGGLFGVYGIAQGIRRTKDFEAALGDMAIQAGKSNAWMETARSRILNVSKAWGLMKEETLGFAAQLVKQTGDVDTALSQLDKMGMIATATGSSMQNLAKTYVSFTGSLGVKGGDVAKAMAILRAQESVGAYSFAQIAQYGGRVFPALGAQGITGLQAVRAGGGLMQIAARSGVDPSTVAQITSRFIDLMYRKSKDVKKKLGVDVEGRDVIAVIQDLSVALQDPKKLIKAQELWGDEASKLVKELKLVGQAGWGGKVGKFESAATIFGAKGDPAELARQAAQRMDQPAQKWKNVMVDLDASMHEYMLPVMEKIVEIMPAVADGLKFLAENAQTLIRVFLVLKASGFINTLIKALTAAQGGPGAGGLGGLIGKGAAGGQAGGGAGGLAGMSALAVQGPALLLTGLVMFSEHFKDKERAMQREAHKERMHLLNAEIRLVQRQAQREHFKAGLKHAKMYIKGMPTAEGAKLLKERERLLPGLKEAWGGTYEMDFRGKSRRYLEKRMASLKALRSRIYTHTRQQAIKAAPQLARAPREAIEKLAPTLQILDATIGKFDRALGQLISGKDINVTAKVEVGPQTPETRTKARSGGR